MCHSKKESSSLAGSPKFKAAIKNRLELCRASLSDQFLSRNQWGKSQALGDSGGTQDQGRALRDHRGDSCPRQHLSLRPICFYLSEAQRF